MTEKTYQCPQRIADLFEDEKTKPEGRAKAIKWMKSLNLQKGDLVWLPEAGWHRYDPAHTVH